MTDPRSRDNAQPARPQPDASEAVELAASDLPAFCPNPNMPIWSSHPRVFLDVSHGGEARCPYCGTRYRLRPGSAPGGHH